MGEKRIRIFEKKAQCIFYALNASSKAISVYGSILKNMYLNVLTVEKNDL